MKDFHLLQGEDNYQLHQLIQEFFRDKQKNIDNADRQKSHLCNAIVEIAKEIPETTTLSNIIKFTPFIPHLSKTANLYQDWLNNDDLLWPFTGLANFYEGQGAYTQALPWFKKCLSICKKRLSKKHNLVATSLNNLATSYHNQGRYKKAESLLKRGLKICIKTQGKEHPDVVNIDEYPFAVHILNNLGTLYSDQGRYKEAEKLCVQALGIAKKTLGEDNPKTITIQDNYQYFINNK